jgi:phosphate transport system substrate-binding protein
MKRNVVLFVLTGLVAFASTSCKRRNAGETKNIDTLSGATSGNVTMYADESFQPLLTSAVNVFQNIYRQTKVDIKYVDEREALQAFLNYQTPVVFLARKLTDKELKDHRDRGYRVQQLFVATDAVAFVVTRTTW